MIDLPAPILMTIFGGYFLIVLLILLISPPLLFARNLISYADKISMVEETVDRKYFLFKTISSFIMPLLIVGILFFVFDQIKEISSIDVIWKTISFLLLITLILFAMPIFVFFLLLQFIVVVQRLHDIGLSGWWYVGVALVSSIFEILSSNYQLANVGYLGAVIFLIFYITLAFMPSKIESNKYLNKNFIGS